MPIQPAKNPPKNQPVAIGLLVIFVAITMAIALFVQLSGYHLRTVDQQDRIYATVVQRTVSHDTTKPPFVMSYPVTQDHKIDGLIRNYVTSLTDTYMKNRGENAHPDEQLAISYEILFYDKATLSVSFRQQIRRGEKVLTSHDTTPTFDIKLHKHLTAKDIVIDTQALNDLIYDYQRANNTQNPYSNAELVHLLDLTTADFKQVTLYGNRIVFSFDPHIPKRMGNPETIAINKSLLHGIVQPAYLHTSPDRSREIQDTTPHITEMPLRDQPIGPSIKKLALTFDDGPDGSTPRLLDALRKYRAHATFFVIGNKASSTTPTLRRIVSEGHEVGNHTWSHSYLTTLTPAEIDRQILDTQAAVQSATGGYTPRLVRPPYGATNSVVTQHLHGLQQTLWTSDTQDWLDKNPDTIYGRIMQGAQPNAVILLHDIHSTSVDAAIRAIRDLRSDGWQLVTVSQL